jgi:histidinol-phosphatase (PHP family)
MRLPADSHVHTEWSYDARRGSMEDSCARAVQLGLPAIAFTEHVDHTVWTVPLESIDPTDPVVSPTGVVTPPKFESSGYFEAIDRCRHLFPALRILTGIEVGEPHWHSTAVATVIASGPFDRVLGSQHCLPDEDGFAEPPSLYRHHDAAQVVRLYLAEVARLVAASDAFSVLAHIDYPVRSWPASNGRFDPSDFEDEFRSVLRILADSGRALEVNTRVPLCSEVIQWWREEGGSAVTFGSDAHHPLTVASGFGLAAAMVEAHGFRPASHPYGLWTCHG